MKKYYIFIFLIFILSCNSSRKIVGDYNGFFNSGDQSISSNLILKKDETFTIRNERQFPIRKKQRKRKRTFIDTTVFPIVDKILTKEDSINIKEIIIEQGFWSIKGDTLFLDVIGQFHEKLLTTEPKYYTLQIEEFIIPNQTHITFHTVNEFYQPFPILSIGINDLNPFRESSFSLSGKSKHTFHVDEISQVAFYRKGIKQEFPIYIPKEKRSNHFQIKLIEVHDKKSRKQLAWSRHYLLYKNKKLHPAFYYKRGVNVSIKAKSVFKEFDFKHFYEKLTP